MFTAGLVILLILICFISAAVFSIFSPFVAAFLMTTFTYAYGWLASLLFNVSNGIELAKKVLFWFAVFLISMIIAPNHTRTTKAGKADKRFKKQIDDDKVNITLFGVCTGLSVLFTLHLINKF